MLNTENSGHARLAVEPPSFIFVRNSAEEWFRRALFLVMLYYQFAVSPTPQHEDFERLGYGIASVMIRAEKFEIETATARAADYLAAEGWQIAEVRQARFADSAELTFGNDETLCSLHAAASEQGIAAIVIAPGAGIYHLRASSVAA